MKRPIVSAGHMDRHPQNDWGSVRYDARFDEYWVRAGSARQCLFFCPWCGERLPPSQRDAWFDALEAEGVFPLHEEVPEAYRSGAWRGYEAPQPTREGGEPIEGRAVDIFDLGDAEEPPA
ncbi:MAG TPA: hypothetical protein VEZ20_13180 [Allosphingosinicella sp.]|jgi:hypothetical protein|nr:hypothetical protein [Allosphingosinicella sp.]